MNNQPWYQSSGGDGLSATIGGVSIVGIGQMIGMVLAWSGHPVDQDAISNFLVTLVTVIGAVYALFGAARKVFFAIIKKTA